MWAGVAVITTTVALQAVREAKTSVAVWVACGHRDSYAYLLKQFKAEVKVLTPTIKHSSMHSRSGIEETSFCHLS